MDLFTGIASGFSVLGGLIACWQAYESKKQASLSKKYRNDVIAKRTTSDFSALDKTLQIAKSDMRKYGASSNKTSLTGCNYQRDAETVQLFIEELKKNKLLFKGHLKKIDELTSELLSMVSQFTDLPPTDYEELKKQGSSIYNRLCDISPIMKSHIDLLKEEQDLLT